METIKSDMKATELRIGNLVNLCFEHKPGWFVASVTSVYNDKTIDTDTQELTGKQKYYFEGVPLTEEWLLKFGFSLHEESHHKFPETRDTFDGQRIVERLDRKYQLRENLYESDWRDLDVLVILDPHTMTLRSMGVIGVRESFSAADIQYVHQLQNIYFALTGEELSIGTINK